MNANLINYLIAAFAGIAAGCTVWLLLDWLGRLQYDKPAAAQAAGDTRHFPWYFGIFRAFVPLLRPLARSQGLARNRTMVERQLRMAGYGETITDEDFVALKLAAWLSGIAMVILGALSGHALFGLLLGVCLALWPALWLARSIRSRQLQIMKALPNVLDLLTLSVEAGKDFMSALRDILARRRLDALGEELERTFQEIQLGKKRSQALRELVERVQYDDFTSVIHAIIQAEELGVSIGQLLRIQGDMLRTKRFTRAEKLANEAPVKMLLPMFLFIFPAVVVILVVALGSQLLNMI